MLNATAEDSSPSLDRQGSTLYLMMACLVAALGGLLFGFDTAVISGAIDQIEAQFHLSALMKGWIVSSALVGCLFGSAIATVDKLGRKPLLLFGIAGVGLMLALSALLMAAEPVAGKWLVVVFALYLACFAVSYGPVCWIIVSEIFPTAIRGRAMSISIFSLWIGCTLVAQTFPKLIETVGTSTTFWLYAMTTPVAFLFVLLLVPETKGKTLEQIERQFVH